MKRGPDLAFNLSVTSFTCHLEEMGWVKDGRVRFNGRSGKVVAIIWHRKEKHFQDYELVQPIVKLRDFDECQKRMYDELKRFSDDWE